MSPHPSQEKVNCALHLWHSVLFRVGAIYPQAALDYVIPLKVGDLWCSPVGTADLTGGVGTGLQGTDKMRPY
jgi:hypothetical protein